MRDLTKGSLVGPILSLAGNWLVDSLGVAIFSLANIYWYGMLGPQAQAAATLIANPVNAALALLPVLTQGSRILIGQAVGAKDKDRANAIFNQVISWSVVLMLVMIVFGWHARWAMGRWLTADAETAKQITAMMKWYIFSIALQFPISVSVAAITGTGNNRPSVRVRMSSILVNMALSPLLIFGWLGFPRLGLAGAGLSHFISALVCIAGLAIYFIGFESYLEFRPRTWISKPSALISVARIGIPPGIQSFVSSSSALALTVFLRPFGPDEMAGMGIGLRIYQIAYLPFAALGGATSIVVAQNVGARNRERIKEAFRMVVLMAIILAPFSFICLQLFPSFLAGLFSDKQDVVQRAATFLRIISIALLPSCVIHACYGVLSGLGKTVGNLGATLLYATLIVVPAWHLSTYSSFEPDWLWYLMDVACVCQMTFAIFVMNMMLRRAPMDSERMLLLKSA